MNQQEITAALGDLREAREKWRKGHIDFRSAYDTVLSRLIYEAAANYMSAAQIALCLGTTPKAVRASMRILGLDPRAGKRALNAMASDAMQTNAALMGIDPKDMDLMSPLAYLPMGKDLRRQLEDRTVRTVDPDPSDDAGRVSGNLTDEEWYAMADLAEESPDTMRAEALWPGFTQPGGYVLRLAIDCVIASRTGVTVSGNAVKDALMAVADEAEEYCHLNHTNPCTCFTVIKRLRNRVAAL